MNLEKRIKSMKRGFKIFAIGTLAGLVFATMPIKPLNAASIGGAETQGKGKFSVGVEQEFVFDRDMKLKSHNESLEAGETYEVETDIDDMYRTMAKISYGMLDNLDAYVKLGTADFESKGNYLKDNAGTGVWDKGDLSFKGSNAFAYGFGLKGTYDLENDWIIGCDVQYLRHKNSFKIADSWSDSDGDSGVSSNKGKATFQEWQVAPYIAKELGNLVPYLGVKYSDLRTKYRWEDEGVSKENKFKADDNFGVFVGTDYKIKENLALNIEGRFIDETAMSFALSYKF